MILFLDVISPIPEFFIIEDNKVIFNEKIITKETDKLSDYIFEKYIVINRDFNLTHNLKNITMTTGPGSYTSLRVGAAFLAGLRISKNLKFCPISIPDIISFKIDKSNIQNIVFYISSSQNQNFLCITNNSKKIEYIRLENNEFLLDKNVNKIFYNFKKFNCENNETKQIKFSFIEEILANHKKLKFTDNSLIKPIYVSNNKILN